MASKNPCSKHKVSLNSSGPSNGVSKGKVKNSVTPARKKDDRKKLAEILQKIRDDQYRQVPPGDRGSTGSGHQKQALEMSQSSMAFRIEFMKLVDVVDRYAMLNEVRRSSKRASTEEEYHDKRKDVRKQKLAIKVEIDACLTSMENTFISLDARFPGPSQSWPARLTWFLRVARASGYPAEENITLGGGKPWRARLAQKRAVGRDIRGSKISTGDSDDEDDECDDQDDESDEEDGGGVQLDDESFRTALR